MGICSYIRIKLFSYRFSLGVSYGSCVGVGFGPGVGMFVEFFVIV